MKNKNTTKKTTLLLAGSGSAYLPPPPLAKIRKSSTCHTERNMNNREERYAIIDKC
jgi:hypothetical protein